MKRFYKTVAVVEEGAGLFSLSLDGKKVQTPARNPLLIGGAQLAAAIAVEWDAQQEDVLPETMALSQLAMTLVDRVQPNRAVLEKEALGYLDTDLLCYRASEPEMYRAAQLEAWDPILAKLEAYLGQKIAVTEGLGIIKQDKSLHDALLSRVAGMDDGVFMALYLVTLGSGSVLTSFAFVLGLIDGQSVKTAAFAEELLKDEIYLGEIYGSAPDQEKRMKMLDADLDAVSRFLALTKEQKKNI